MSRLRELQGWIDDHRDMAFDLVRVYLGIGLFVKGLEFVSDQEFLARELRAGGAEFRFDFLETFLAHYIPLAHMGGGLLLAAGLMTRISTLFQLPVLLGAVVLSYREEGLFTHNRSFQFEMLVLFLLLLILVHGAGRLSLDWLLRQPRA
jgi:uncharacterized membrane protein YphA (DoxX/SURF4 family)